jgi:NAD(P)-dependent dehydrogenase (short-subunit alcohol dehydrogenase family)
MDLELAGRGALVVGATGEIGRAVVARLEAEGARVVAAARSAAKLERLFPAGAGRVEMDLRDDASIATAVQDTQRILGGIDVLVCTAAGEVPYGVLWTAKREDWIAEMSLKCIGTSQVCTRVAEGMKKQGSGAIVTVIGIATDMVVTQNPIGSAVNSGLRSFTRVLAADLAPAGIRVNGVSPGMVDGERFNRFATGRVEQIRASIPMGSIGTPDQFADVIVFAASPRAGYMTGAILTVDGGLTLVR